MSYMKEFDIEKYEEMEIDVAVDKMCEHTWCLQCGSNPTMVPMWTGKENYYTGHCECSEEEQEFVYDPETPEEKI